MPLYINRSNVALYLCEGTALEALRGEYHGLHDMLLRIESAINVTVATVRSRAFDRLEYAHGSPIARTTAKQWPWQYADDVLPSSPYIQNDLCKPPAGPKTMPELRMWQEDYKNATIYNGSEWRHSLALYSSSNVSVLGPMLLTRSGGDGIYVDGASNSTLAGLWADWNFRNAMSVISARNLTVDSCVFSNTTGTAPRAGIDFEPNGASDALHGIRLSNCLAGSNGGSGFGISISALTNSSLPVDVSFRRSVSRDSYVGGGLTSYTFKDAYDGPAGVLAFTDGAIVHSKNPGVSVSTPASRIRVLLENTTITGTAFAHQYWSPMEVVQSRAGAGRMWASGGLHLRNVTVEDPQAVHRAATDPTRPYLHVCDECVGVEILGTNVIAEPCSEDQDTQARLTPNCTAAVDGPGSRSARGLNLSPVCRCL